MATWEYFADIFGTYYIVFILCVGHTSFFLISFTMSWPSPVLTKLKENEDNPLGRIITSEESDLIGSLLFVGASVGPLMFIHVVKKFGRKKVLVLLLTIVPLTYGTLIFGKNVELYYICRLLLGLYIGATLSVLPVYLSEIIAPEDVAFYMSFETAFGYTGILLAYLLGAFTPLKYFNGGITILSVVNIILLAIGCPESPYHVMKVEGKDEAQRVLRRLRKHHIEKELENIEKTTEYEPSSSCFEFFKNKKYFKYFISATIPLLLQQFSGITLIVTYNQLIFQETNLPLAPDISSIIVVVLLESTSFIAPVLLKSKKFTVKSMMTLSLSGTAFCNLVISLYFFYGKNISSCNWVPLAGLILFVVFFNCGMDPIAWTNLGQTYPKNINTVGTALTTSFYFISIFPILYSFYKVDMTYLFLCSFLSGFLGVLYVKFAFTESNANMEIVENSHLQTALI